MIVVNNHLGGLRSGGLDKPDIGNHGNAYLVGMARAYSPRAGAKHNKTGAKFRFGPKVAQAVFNGMVPQAGVPVHFGRRHSNHHADRR